MRTMLASVKLVGVKQAGQGSLNIWPLISDIAQQQANGIMITHKLPAKGKGAYEA